VGGPGKPGPYDDATPDRRAALTSETDTVVPAVRRWENRPDIKGGVVR
jgi:hypothetical protein